MKLSVLRVFHCFSLEHQRLIIFAVIKILDLQTRAVQHRQRKKSSRKSEKDKQQQDKVKLFCRKCQVFVCSGDSIRCIKEAHHVVTGRDVWSKFYFKKSKCSRVINGVELTGL